MLTSAAWSSGNSPAGTASATSYEGLATPTETELSMSPISTSSQSSLSNAAAAAGAGPGAGAAGLHGHEQWTTAAAALPPQQQGYDSYFPVTAGQADHAVFHKTYHIN